MGLRILIAPDKFKGSLSGSEICRILKADILATIPNAQVESCPLADGGDGSVEILANYLNLKKRNCSTVDPIGRPIESAYYFSKNTAYIELASASGLVLLDDSDRNPMQTSTFGTGLLILDAIKRGIENIYLFLGGSATNDGGIGIAKALGYTFLDITGNELNPIGASLQSIVKIVPPKEVMPIKKLMLCCDVENPPYGPYGAAFVYAEQKGANEKEIIELDDGISNLCSQIKNHSGVDLSILVGGGAAGGVAICLSALFGAEIKSGMDMISKTVKLEQKIANSDIVISGEGRLDKQSLNGKVVSGVAELCRKYGKKLLMVVGSHELTKTEIEELGVKYIYSVLDYAKDIQDAISNGHKYVKEIGSQIGKDLS